ncbi:MAG: hypothetical protein AABY22_02420, partial [Nanoarchaeota archaeon]
NHPELVIRDLREYLGLDEEKLEFVRKVMLARGINKWLKVRRDLIAYKKSLRNTIKETQKELSENPSELQKIKLKERLKFTSNARGVLKGLCMTERWQIWPKNGHIREGVRSMNTIKASGN